VGIREGGRGGEGVLVGEGEGVLVGGGEGGDTETKTVMEVEGDEYVETVTEMEVAWEKTGEYEGEEDVSVQQSSNSSDHANDNATSPSSPLSQATNSISKSKIRKRKPKKTITDYFKATKALKPLGRPKKRKQKNNHATADVDIPIEMRKSPPEELFTAKPEINSPPDALCTKQKRINWGKPGPNHDKMLRTIDHWLNDGDDRFDTNGERFKDYRTYTHSCGIPLMSLYRYIHPDALKRLQLGDGSRGKEKLLTDEEVLFMGHVMARQDHANDGLMRKEAKDIIVDVSKQDITFRAAGLQLSRCVLPVNAEKKILKPTLQMPQATTSDQTNMNIAQQYRWHRLVVGGPAQVFPPIIFFGETYFFRSAKNTQKIDRHRTKEALFSPR